MDAEIKKISISEIDDPQQPMRSALDKDGIWELAESIKERGLINPITVRKKGERFEVVAGHRRFTAARLANLSELSCVVRELSDADAFSVMAAENLERQDVDVVDEAIFVGRLCGEDENNIRAVARQVRRTEAWVRSRLDILTMPEYLIEALKFDKVKLGVALWLNQVGSEFWKKQYVEMAVSNGMSITQARYLHDQWEMGLAQEPGVALASAPDAPVLEPTRSRARCVACGTDAVEPNMQLLWCHVQCPRDSAPEAQDEDLKTDAPE